MSYELLGFLTRAKYLARAWLLACACLGASLVFAQALPSTPYPFPVTTSGNVRAYQGGTATAANAGSINFPPAANDPISARVNTTHPLPNGQSVPVTTKSVPSSANVAKALGNFAKKVLPVIATAVAIKQLLEELGYNIGQDAQGNNVVQKPGTTPAGCYTAPCYYYNTLNPLGTITGTYNGLGEAQAAYIYGREPGGYFVERPEGNAWDYYRPPPDNTREPFAIARAGQRAPDPPPEPTWDPATWEEIEADIAANNQTGWPTGSAAPDALRDAVASGEPLPLPEPAEVTGPASAPGPSKTSTQTNKDAQGNPTGTTTSVTNTTYNISYGPNTITTTTTNTTNITNPDGTTQTVEEAAQDPAPEEEPQPDMCEKYPDSLGCQEIDTPADEVPKTTRNVTFTPESLGLGAGSCPSPIGWNDSLGSHAIDLAPVCDKLTSVVRPIVLAFALLAAFFIVAPVRQEG